MKTLLILCLCTSAVWGDFLDYDNEELVSAADPPHADFQLLFSFDLNVLIYSSNVI